MSYLFSKYCPECGQWPTHKAGCSNQIDWSQVHKNIRKENEYFREQEKHQKPTREQMEKEFDQ